MGLQSDIASNKERGLKLEVKKLRKQVELLSTALEAARHSRPIRPIKASGPRHQTGDIVRVIIPDSHGSSQDNEAVAALLADLKTIDPDEIILLGDHVDCGGFLAQHHTLGYVSQTEYSYEEDIQFAKHFLDAVQRSAPRAKAVYLEGNHEQRIERWAVTETLRNRKDADMLRRMFAPNILLKLAARNIPFYRMAEKYDGLTLPGTIKRGKCYFTHGFSTSKHAAAAHLAKMGGNIVFGHTHRMDVATHDIVNAGTIGAWSPGCLCKKQPLWQNTNPTDWTHGYGVQLVDRHSGNFLHLNIPIVKGISLMKPLLNHGLKK